MFSEAKGQIWSKERKLCGGMSSDYLSFALPEKIFDYSFQLSIKYKSLKKSDLFFNIHWSLSFQKIHLKHKSRVYCWIDE